MQNLSWIDDMLAPGLSIALKEASEHDVNCPLSNPTIVLKGGQHCSGKRGCRSGIAHAPDSGGGSGGGKTRLPGEGASGNQVPKGLTMGPHRPTASAPRQTGDASGNPSLGSRSDSGQSLGPNLSTPRSVLRSTIGNISDKLSGAGLKDPMVFETTVQKPSLASKGKYMVQGRGRDKKAKLEKAVKDAGLSMKYSMEGTADHGPIVVFND